MDVFEFRKLRKRLTGFLRRFDGCIKMKATRQHLRTYVRGQLSDLERKSVEPIALASKVAPRTLQEFLGFHRWDHEKMRDRIREIVIRDHYEENAVAVVDETSFAKKGDKTAGVQRQYCGAKGKTENCVVTVHLGYATSDFHTILDGDLYLPEEKWAEDRARCKEAGIPDDVVYRPKWRIALDLLDRALDGGAPLRYTAADEAYGQIPGFRQGVARRGLTYVVEVPRSVRGWTRRPRLAPETAGGQGRPRTVPRLAEGEKPSRKVAHWSRPGAGGGSWQAYHIKDTEKGPVVWEARARRFHMARKGVPTGEEGWLIVARNTTDGEIKYFFSNAGADTPIELMLEVAFRRWRIERSFEDAKGQVGLDHFEVRNYRSLIRHLILTHVSLLFLMRETQRLRGEKISMVESPAGPAGRGGTTRSRRSAPRGPAAARRPGSEDRALASLPRQGRRLAPQTKVARTPSQRIPHIENAQVLRDFVAL